MRANPVPRPFAVAAWLAGCLLTGCAGTPAPEGPADDARVAFEGAKSLSEADLRRAIESDLRSYAASPRETVLDDAAFRIRVLYTQEGYARVRVERRVEPGRVVFRIEEGPLFRLGRVHFEGNASLSEEKLRGAGPKGLLEAEPAYSPRLEAVLVDRVLAEYGARGYIEATVAAPEVRYDEETRRAHVTIRITEGKAYRVAGWAGPPADPALASKLEVFVGRPYTPHTVGEVEAVVIDHLRENGRPFARVQAIPEVDRAEGAATLKLELEPGAEARIAGLRISRNERTRASFIESRADLERGRPYRASDVRRAEERLMATRLFRTARLSPGAFQEATGDLTLDLEVEEREAGEVSVRAGYSSLDGARFGGDVGYHSLFGGGESLRAGATVGGLGYRADVEAGLPYFLGTELRPGATGYYENQQYPSFDAASTGAVLSLYAPLAERLGATTGVRYAVIRTDDVEDNVPPGDLLDFEYAALFLSTSWDGRDSALLPTRGFLLSGLAEWAGRTISPDIQFANAVGRATIYLPLPWDLVLAASFQGGVIVPVDDTEVIPISLRHFAGGTNTVRGFEFGTIGPRVDGEPTGGELYLAMQAELRFPIWGDLHGAAFTDRGGVWFEHDDLDLDDTRYSVGLGLRYYTPGGAVVADVAWNPDRKEEEGEEALEFHLSVGFPF